MRFVKEAWPFVVPFGLLAALFASLRRTSWTLLCLFTGGLVLLFFRDPERRFRGADNLMLAPADGKILAVDMVEDPQLGPGIHRRIITFLSVFDVHVQRVPTSGEVVASSLTRGRKLAAFDARAGEVNEQHLTVIQRAGGDRIGVRQIAGLVARRVVSYLDEGDVVRRGEHLGVIKFGSRVDLLVPADYRVVVQEGDRVVSGLTVMALAPESTATSGGGSESRHDARA